MTFDTLLLSIEDRVATVAINRPDKRNALNTAVRDELVQALDALRDEPGVRVVILTGTGDKAFVAGADITEFADRSALEQRAVMAGRRVFDEIAAFPKPTIAMINGVAAGGGCELAMACDIRIAGRSARFGQPEIRLGLIPGGGGTQRLPRLVGAGRALRMILTGELIDAEEAWRTGLVDVLVDDDALRDRTMEVARTIAAHSPVAVRLAKAAVAAAWEAPLGAGLALERELFVTAFGSDDRREGVAAFVEKRRAVFQGL
jgi:enoyl-CoA hydratase